MTWFAGIRNGWPEPVWSPGIPENRYSPGMAPSCRAAQPWDCRNPGTGYLPVGQTLAVSRRMAVRNYPSQPG